MTSGVRILFEGLPERVQWIADVLDRALPGRVIWQEAAEPGDGPFIGIVGAVAPPANDMVATELCRSLPATAADVGYAA